MMKHGEEYNTITSLVVGDVVDNKAFNTLMSGNKPRVVFSEGNVNAGDQVIFKAETTFLPYPKCDKDVGRTEDKFHRWIPGYGAAHSNWVFNGKKDINGDYRATKKDVHLEDGKYRTKKQDSVDRLEEEISAWAVFSPKKKVDRNVTFETLIGGVGKDHIKFKVDTEESKHGDSKDTVVIMAFGQ